MVLTYHHQQLQQYPLITVDPTKGIKVDSGIIAHSFRDVIKQKVVDLQKQGIGKIYDF
jgi:hypothetical protein